MSRILAIDYGKKRCGISVTDPLQIIVSGLDTLATIDLQNFLTKYCEEESVKKIVFGLPLHADGTHTFLKADIDKEIATLKKIFPQMDIDFQDESFTSVDAKEIMLNSGLNKKKRREKSRVDKISAILILQKYLKHI